MATKKPAIPTLPTVSPRVPDGGESVVLERRAQKIEPPQVYQVAMLNDDYTPMEFVVMLIQEFFSRDREAATLLII
jgi:ATP-dependent Clp protease adaptor protein ClpS